MHANAAVVSIIAFAALGLAYVVYGRYLARHIFKLSNTRQTPANEFEDGVDYVPTGVPILFGHHFASIAGLGPILGPAIAVIWGWLPAVIWVVFGSIFIGAVHDLGALSVSLRYKGRSIGDVTRELIGARARLLFLLIIFFLLALAMGVFVLVIAQLFVYYYPNAILPSFGLIVVAVIMGVSVYKLKAPLGPLSLAGIAALFLLIHAGVKHPLPTYTWEMQAAQSEQIHAMVESDVIEAPYGADAVMRVLDSPTEHPAEITITAFLPRCYLSGCFYNHVTTSTAISFTQAWRCCWLACSKCTRKLPPHRSAMRPPSALHRSSPSSSSRSPVVPLAASTASSQAVQRCANSGAKPTPCLWASARC
jgi:hypothetical protein